MRIIHTGNGKSGSWQIRGAQLGWEPIPNATKFDADWVVQVKKPPSKALLKSGVPWVWDVVDFYPQPQCSGWSRQKSIDWVKRQIDAYNPRGVIFPNEKMWADCRTDIPATVIYHHHRPGMKLNPVRDQIHGVGYEGDPRYLGRWHDVIMAECRRRGWCFYVNHGQHADWDICVAFRDAQFNGYPQYHWKSNVKLANAHGSGTPFIGPREYGYTETQCGREIFIDDHKQLSRAFDELEPQKIRAKAHNAFLDASISVAECRKQLKAFLRGL